MFCSWPAHLAVATLAAGATVVSAQPARLYDGTDGATCEYWNLGARIAWREKQGDWRDAADTAQGSVPFARTVVHAADTHRVVRWDVTSLVQGWVAGTWPNDGLMIASVLGPPAGTAVFHSRESTQASLRPTLVIERDDGGTRRLAPVADTTLACSTVYSIGSQQTLTAGGERRVMIQFDLGAEGASRIARATLELATTERQYGDTALGVFRLDPPGALHEEPLIGIAARYSGDRGLERDPDVIMATGFESPLWWTEWSYVDVRGSLARAGRGDGLGFEPLSGQALRVRIPKGEHLGLDVRYRFADKLGTEPEEVYFRYYLRFASDWSPTTDGGKLPGISGTYGKAGWGGRPSAGDTGWSMRGGFFRQPNAGNPYVALTPIGTYAYQPDTDDFWGEDWAWSIGLNGLLERNRWYCIEQYVKLNRPGHRDAVFRGWVDGRLAFEKTGFRVRETPAIRVEQIWMNVYYGGSAPSPQDQHLFIDNVAIARRYIGPMAK